jgi:hypothetical protein
MLPRDPDAWGPASVSAAMIESLYHENSLAIDVKQVKIGNRVKNASN